MKSNTYDIPVFIGSQKTAQRFTKPESQRDKDRRRKHFSFYFEYRDGQLFWAIDMPPNAKAGERAGGVKNNGYREVSFYGHRYLEHRIVYALHTGEMPEFIDHINGNKSDNRIENLRPATHAENMRNRKAYKNNKLGLKGVSQESPNSFNATIYVDGKPINLGNYSTPEKAYASYCNAVKLYHGDFANSGS